MTIDRAERSVISRRTVCREPRGIAVDAAAERLLVACAEGLLAELPFEKNGIARQTFLGADLRDVVVSGDDVYVSRFRSAELIKLDAERKVVLRKRPPNVTTTLPIQDFVTAPPSFEAGVAWRMLPHDDGVVVLHQRASTVPVNTATVEFPQAAAYGGELCEGIVQPGVTLVASDGTLRTSARIGPAVLAVDIAVSPDSRLIALAQAGVADDAAPRPHLVFENGATAGVEFAPTLRAGLIVVEASELEANEENGVAGCVTSKSDATISEPVTAVAFDARGRLLAQVREPSALLVVDTATWRINRADLGGDDRTDTGHELFHRDAGAGIACASCHPEGTEDGRVWHFDFGARRTQALNAGLQGTAPFHWNGALRDIDALMTEVSVTRMGGVPQSSDRIESLSSYLFQLKPPTPVRSADDPAAQRGKLWFESERTRCATCHSGDRLTNNATVDVGTGSFLQVPSLVGVSRRAPYLHDGCAPSLDARFTSGCGGFSHGDVSWLSAAELDDLVAYLETL